MLANGNVRISDSSKLGSKEMVCPEPTSFEKLNWLIHLQHVRGETAACKDLVKSEILKSSGRNEYAYFKQGIIFRQENKIQDALESFQTCLKLNPDNMDNLKEVAKCLYDMRRFRLALEAFLEAERTSTSPDWQIYYNAGQCFMRLGDMAKAKDYAHRAVELDKHETSYALLIKILILEGDLKSAVAVANAAVESCPDSVSMLTESGLLFLKMGQTQHAFERLSSALALDPTSAKALLGVGCITQKHQEYDVALTKYKIAVLYDSDSVALWNNIGLCFYSKQKYVAAISCLKRALWISPLNWRVLFNLGIVHLATHQPASAFNFLCAAVNLRPDIAGSFAALGCSLLELNDPENAARAMKQALSLTQDDPEIVVNTAVCLILMGLSDHATPLIDRYQSLINSGVTVTQEVEELYLKIVSSLEVNQETKGNQNGHTQNEELAENFDGVVSPSFENAEEIDNSKVLSSNDLLEEELVQRELANDEV